MLRDLLKHLVAIWFGLIATVLTASAASVEDNSTVFADVDLSSIHLEKSDDDFASQEFATGTQTGMPTNAVTPLQTTIEEDGVRTKPDSEMPFSVEQFLSPSRIGSSLKLIITMSVISLAPAILLMTTSFIRISIVLGLLRQAFGAQQIPPNQVMTSLALFMTIMIMWPIWSEVYETAVEPYANPQTEMSWQQAWDTGIRPVRTFMIRQIELTQNADDVRLFMRHIPGATENPTTYDDVPTQALLPAFVLSELKTAFLLGFQIYLPFLIIDLVVATLTTSMGMIMLPPTMVSMPLKLLLFVLVDGWHLLVGMLLESFRI